MMDIFYIIGQNLYQGLQASFNIDAGSGIGAKNISYAGNGTSGVDAWRSSMLPPAAWAMAGTATFHDDFDSINTIDVNNTIAPGYKWYVNNIWPASGWTVTHDGQVPTPSNQISVSGSKLTLQQWQSHINQAQIMSAAAVGGGTASETATSTVGQGFIPPFLLEVKVSFDPLNTVSGGSAYLHWFLGEGTLGIPYPTFPPGVEIDPYGPGGYSAAFATIWTWNQGVPPGLPYLNPKYGGWSGCVGYSAWDPAPNYSANAIDVVSYGGNFYVALNMLPTNNINNQPDISPSFWALITPRPATNASSYDILNFGNLNVASTLILPTPFNDSGWIIEWFNGAPCSGIPQGQNNFPCITYSPLVSNAGIFPSTSYIQRWTVDPLVLILFAGSDSAALPAQYDYISVIQ